MFKQSSESTGGNDQAETIIGPSVKVEGDLQAIGHVLIEGMVDGTITTDGNITIGSESVINADIHANNASIAGKVKGKINIKGNISLKSSAVITGDIKTSTISIENGAQVNGQLVMGAAAAPQAQKEESEEE